MNRPKRYLLRIACALISLMCIACSPQQRLTRLLAAHPELLVRDTTLQCEITAAVPYEHHDTTVAIADTPCNCDSLLHAAIGDSLTVSAGHATAVLTYQPGQLTLQAQQQPDTIRRFVPVKVPVVEYVEVEREETPLQAFFRISGIIFWTLLAVAFIVRIIKHSL